MQRLSLCIRFSANVTAALKDKGILSSATEISRAAAYALSQESSDCSSLLLFFQLRSAMEAAAPSLTPSCVRWQSQLRPQSFAFRGASFQMATGHGFIN